MIVARAPLRISFAGGGTDLPWYYEKCGGQVVGSAIDKYVWITVNKKFDNRLRVSYSKTENVNCAADLQHDLVKAGLRSFGLRRGLEITSIGDVPGEGTGLGSSSAFLVALLLALETYTGAPPLRPALLAETAAAIEIETLRRPIGKQDHYFAAFGGMRQITFKRSGEVHVTRLSLPEDQLNELQSSLLLLYTGLTRSAHSIHRRIQQAAAEKEKPWHMMKQIHGYAAETVTALESGLISDVGVLMYESWLRKKALTTGVSNPMIDAMMKTAIEAGAIGGKILGAGGGGFLLLQADRKRHDHIVGKTKLRRLRFKLDAPGAEVVYDD